MEMNSYINKFKKVRTRLLNGEKIVAIVGNSENDGNLISLGNFLNNLEL